MVVSSRGFTRHAVRITVEMRGPDAWLAAETIDVSRSGLFVRLPPALSPAPIMQLRILLGDDAPLVALGRVTRQVGSAQGGEGASVGLELLSMSQSHRERWDAFIVNTSRSSQAMSAVDVTPEGRRSVIAGAVDVIASRPVRSSVPPPVERIDAPQRRRSTGARPVSAPNHGERRTTSPADARTPAPDAVTAPQVKSLRLRPEGERQLKTLVDRRIEVSELYVRPEVPVVAGEKVQLVLIHYQNDTECVLSAVVDGVVPASAGVRPGALLAFAPATEAEVARLRAFAVAGAVAATTTSAVIDPDAEQRVAELQAAVARRPEDARQWIRLGWALLLCRRPEEAIEPLQRGVTLAPTMPVAQLLLLMAHGLAGDGDGARALLARLDGSALLEPLLD